MTAPAVDWVDGVLRFWFETLRPRDRWSAAPAVDATIAARFASLWDALRASPPPPAALDARGHLAAILVFDQFPRQIHRGTPAAYATDDLALRTAEDAVDRRLDASLSVVERHFLYMPFMHAEDAAAQRRSLALFTALGDADALRHTERHRRAIERFGRFPWRNAVLGRASTDDERRDLERDPGPR